MGSGVRNITKYNKIYSGAIPTFVEGDVFKTIIPLSSETIDQATNQADSETERILEFCRVPRSRDKIQEFIEYKNRGYFRTKILNPLIKGGLLKLTIPDKPTSPKQKYYYSEEN